MISPLLWLTRIQLGRMALAKALFGVLKRRETSFRFGLHGTKAHYPSELKVQSDSSAKPSLSHSETSVQLPLN